MTKHRRRRFKYLYNMSKILTIAAAAAADINFDFTASPLNRPLAEILAGSQYVERAPAETDETLLQIIPYVVLTSANSTGDAVVFNYSRAKSGGEARLHAKRSIGVGGHIDWEDGNDLSLTPVDAFFQALQREVKEEVGHDCKEIRTIALLHDKTNAVGRVHLGVLCVVQIPTEEMEKMTFESDIADPRWDTVSSLLTDYNFLMMETWSQAALEFYIDDCNKDTVDETATFQARQILRRAAFNARFNTFVLRREGAASECDTAEDKAAHIALQESIANSCDLSIARLLVRECD